MRHVPASNNLDQYDTGRKEVRQWLNRVIVVFEELLTTLPVLIHCTSGKDRTGVVVAALLKILDVPDPVIVEEYLLSEGDVKEEWIRLALDSIGDLQFHFNRVDLGKVRSVMLSSIRFV